MIFGCCEIYEARPILQKNPGIHLEMKLFSANKNLTEPSPQKREL